MSVLDTEISEELLSPGLFWGVIFLVNHFQFWPGVVDIEAVKGGVAPTVKSWQNVDGSCQVGCARLKIPTF